MSNPVDITLTNTGASPEALDKLTAAQLQALDIMHGADAHPRQREAMEALLDDLGDEMAVRERPDLFEPR